jgi:hypothetical protein
MDLFDLGCYFAHIVPVQAVANPLLRYSACAYAAKQLGRVRGKKAIVGGTICQQADMETYPHPETVDWAYLGAKYYDKAIQLLMEELSNSGNQDMPMTPIQEEVFTPRSSSIHTPQSIPSGQGNKRRRLSRHLYASSADETLAAAAILCVYEFLDNANTVVVRLGRERRDDANTIANESWLEFSESKTIKSSKINLLELCSSRLSRCL